MENNNNHPKAKKRRWKKVLLIILGILVGLFIFAIIFLKTYPSFGGQVTNEDRKKFASRVSSDYYKDEKFTNGDDFKLMTNGSGSNNKYSTKGTSPKDELPVMTPDFSAKDDDNVYYTWFGHSSFLLHMHGLNILIDPMFSKKSSPFTWVGPDRFSKCPVSVKTLPHIDAVFYSHDHYDHLDYEIIKDLDRITDKFYVPVGIDKHLIRWGVDKKKIQNMTWWEEFDYKGIKIACTPTQHFSGRNMIDSNETLWASIALMNENWKIYYSGDGGMDERFEKIHDKYGDFDFSIMECGQYSPSWSGVHMFPEEAVDASDTLGSTYTTPVHWGAFVLSSHAWDDSAERFTRDYEDKHEDTSNLITPEIGQTICIKHDGVTETKYWWKDYE